MSGVRLSVINMKLQVVRLGTVKFIPQKRILSTVLHVEVSLYINYNINEWIL